MLKYGHDADFLVYCPVLSGRLIIFFLIIKSIENILNALDLKVKHNAIESCWRESPTLLALIGQQDLELDPISLSLVG
jgi:hypothetical protein